jgi:FtsZ-binding cell division protein ZapB
MARQKHPPTKFDRSEISPIEVDEDSPAKPPDSPRPNLPPPVISLNHQKNSGEACIDTFPSQFEDDQQPTITNDNMYEKSYANPAATSKNPSLCYDKITEESLKREDFLKRLNKKNNQLKKEVKEYQFITHVIQQENNWFKSNNVNLQQEIRKLKRKNKKISDATL